MNVQKVRPIANSLYLVLISTVAVISQPYKFDFGSGEVASGYTKITPQTKFSSSQGYGIEKGDVSSVTSDESDKLKGDYLTATNEMYFTIAVPQGNYDLTVIFGDAKKATSTTIKAENRRLLFDRVTTAAGTYVTKTITVNRREVRSIDGSVTMSIKDREKTYLTWDEVLTISITGKNPAVCAMEIVKNDTATTLFLCGNSTVVDQLTAPWCSWGQMFPYFFKPGVVVANYAESGLTASGFLSMRRLDKIIADAKAGDYVFVEFGHNDQKNSGDVANYANNLKTFRDKIKAKGAIPVYVAPTARQAENDPRTSVGGLAQKMRETAVAHDVVCIDLNQMVIDLHNSLGNDLQYLYMYTVGDKTHFCEYGAFELARCVMKGIEEEFPSLKGHFISDYTTFDPSEPDPLDYLTKEKDPVKVFSVNEAAGEQSISFDRGTFTARFIRPEAGFSVEVYSINGKRLLRKKVRSGVRTGSVRLPVSKLNSGCCIVKAAQGNVEQVMKVNIRK